MLCTCHGLHGHIKDVSLLPLSVHVLVHELSNPSFEQYCEPKTRMLSSKAWDACTQLHVIDDHTPLTLLLTVYLSNSWLSSVMVYSTLLAQQTSQVEQSCCSQNIG